MFFPGKEPKDFQIGRLAVSKKSREQMSISAKKRGPNNKGKKFSSQACKNMSNAKLKFLKENPEYEIPNIFKPGNIPWNKGLTKETDERVAKSAEKFKKARPAGYTYDEKTRRRKLIKEVATKKKNRSYSTSTNEEITYLKLVEKFGKQDIVRQYATDERYPFACDFYIISKDLFIEINIFWMHGPHLFDKTNEEDIKLLDKWKNRCKYILTSKGKMAKNSYYRAIYTWTIADIKKYNIAKENNLNILFVYKEDFDDFIARI